VRRARECRPPSPLFLAAAQTYLRRFTARHFSALRIAVDGGPPALDRPTVFFANHPSWWDPIVLVLLIRTHYPDWRFHGPIDAAVLERYPWLERLGLFGIEPDSARGARRLLEAGDALLTAGRSGLALTAQGRFADVRARPLALKPGLAALLKRHPAAAAIPIAIEYAFWNERLPEILVRFGPPVTVADAKSTVDICARLETALERELDRLAAAALARDARAFTSLIEGRRGIGFLPDLTRRLRARLRGERFDASHAAVGRNPG
jgi:1-acyl-sn-glycerol-3-phosphate acyltransferase